MAESMMRWREEMVLDHGSLDTDHRRQHALITRFIRLPGEESDRARALDLLRELRELSVRHFEREERVQIYLRYPLLTEHRAQHQRLRALLDDIIGQVDALESPFTFAYTKEKANELLQFWFLDHFAKADLPLKAHIAKFAARQASAMRESQHGTSPRM